MTMRMKSLIVALAANGLGAEVALAQTAAPPLSPWAVLSLSGNMLDDARVTPASSEADAKKIAETACAAADRGKTCAVEVVSNGQCLAVATWSGGIDLSNGDPQFKLAYKFERASTAGKAAAPLLNICALNNFRCQLESVCTRSTANAALTPPAPQPGENAIVSSGVAREIGAKLFQLNIAPGERFGAFDEILRAQINAWHKAGGRPQTGRMTVAELALLRAAPPAAGPWQTISFSGLAEKTATASAPPGDFGKATATQCQQDTDAALKAKGSANPASSHCRTLVVAAGRCGAVAQTSFEHRRLVGLGLAATKAAAEQAALASCRSVRQNRRQQGTCAIAKSVCVPAAPTPTAAAPAPQPKAN